MRPCRCCWRCCCCCCSFFRPRQLECSFSPSPSPCPLPSPAWCCTRCPVGGRQCRVSGQVGSGPGRCKREQPRTAVQRRGGQTRGFLLASLRPSRHHPAYCQVPRYLIHASCPLNQVLQDFTTNTCRHIPVLSSALKYKNLDRHPKGATVVYESTGRWLAPGEMKMGSSLGSQVVYCVRDMMIAGKSSRVGPVGASPRVSSFAPVWSSPSLSPSSCPRSPSCPGHFGCPAHGHAATRH